jgi:hypothetical protein
MYSSGGTDGRDHSPDSSQPWAERNRDRRQHQRKVIDLKTCPEPRRHHVASWLIGTNGVEDTTDLFISVCDKIFEVLRQRNIDEGQRREASQALCRARVITISRYYMSGWMFTWSDKVCSYYIVIRERDPLTRRLDCEQPPFEMALREAV